MYRCVAISVAGFLQQLAVSYVGNGYFFYVTGLIPADKDPTAVDAKLIERYGIDCSKWANARRQERGEAKVQYLRFGQFFALMATAGRHPFFHNESQFADIRRKPILCFGYSVGCWHDEHGNWRPSVRLTETEYERIRSDLLEMATHATPEELDSRLRRLRLSLFAPVRRQLWRIVRDANQAREACGLEPVPFEVGPRRPVRPFGAESSVGPLVNTRP